VAAIPIDRLGRARITPSPGDHAVALSPDRQREIADFLATHERLVRQSVAYRVRHLA